MAGKWKTLTFADAPLEIIDGDRGVNYPKQTDFSTHGDCLFLNTGNVTTSGFDFTTLSFIAKTKDASLRKGKLQRRDVVLTTRGTIGNVAFFDKSVYFDHIRINSGMVVLRTDQDRLSPNYFYQFVKSRLFKLQIASLTTGSAQPQLPIRDIREIEIPLPPLPVQKRIADILGSLDDKIELNRKMNETLEAMARALFKSWFVDFDPVVAKSEGRQPVGMDAETAKLFPDTFEDSEIGRIPKGWKVGRFADVVQNRREVISAEQLSSEAYIGLEHMPRRSIALSGWGDSSALESAKSRFRKNDILFGKLRPYFHKVGIAPIEGVCSTDILVLKPQTTEWAAFALGYASSDEMVDYADSCSTGTRMPRVNWSDLARYQIPIPPQSLAGRLTMLQEPVIESIFNNIQKNRILANLRDTLLPRLLSGELAVATD